MEITRLGTQASAKGPADWFTGSVRIDPLFQPNGQRRAAASKVTFEPGARTAWHTHPLGQTLSCLGSVGYNVKVDQSKKFDRGMLFGLNPMKSIGTELPQLSQ